MERCLHPAVLSTPGAGPLCWASMPTDSPIPQTQALPHPRNRPGVFRGSCHLPQATEDVLGSVPKLVQLVMTRKLREGLRPKDKYWHVAQTC